MKGSKECRKQKTKAIKNFNEYSKIMNPVRKPTAKLKKK